VRAVAKDIDTGTRGAQTRADPRVRRGQVRPAHGTPVPQPEQAELVAIVKSTKDAIMVAPLAATAAGR
jgi:hypothetical protein